MFLQQLVPGYQEAVVVLTACRLRIFEALDGQRLASTEVARALDLKPEAAERLLNALAGLGLLTKTGGRFCLSVRAREHLSPAAPGYLGNLFRHHERMVRRWLLLEARVRRGPRRQRDEAADDEEFILAMEANARRIAPRVVRSVDLRGVRRLLDVGGGPGTYARLFAKRYSGLAVTVFDRQEITAAVRRLGLRDPGKPPIRYRSGDFLCDDLGRGYDAVWASNVLHTLSPEGAKELLGRCRAALRRGGRLLVHDFFLGPGHTRPRRAAVFSVHMLAVTASGRAYGMAEMIRFMEAAGLRNVRRTASFGSTAVLLGERP